MYGLLGSDNIWLRYNRLKITFKVVKIVSLMHITNQKLSSDIFTVGNSWNIFMEHDLYLIS